MYTRSADKEYDRLPEAQPVAHFSIGTGRMQTQGSDINFIFIPKLFSASSILDDEMRQQGPGKS